MSRGLGKQQRKVVAAIHAVHEKRGPDWIAPGDVLAELEKPSGNPSLDAMKLTVMLINATSRAARGDRQAAALVADLERQGASRTWKARAFSPPRPMGKRLTPPRRHHCERINPTRILAALEKRGIVERLPEIGPKSRLRLVAVSKMVD